jgi:SAM-dependent methyltransferase
MCTFMEEGRVKICMDRSKNHFRNASAQKTWADASKWPLAGRTCAFIMKVMEPKGKVCLSLGCGWGRFLHAYYENEAERVIGIDINKENLLKCKNTGAELVLGDIENLPFQCNIFEAMECIATMEHISRPEKVVKELRRIISETHGLVFISWNHYDWLQALYNRDIRIFLIWTVRDLIYELFPVAIRNTLLKSAVIRSTFLAGYGVARYGGFSFPTVMQIFENASMHVILAKYLRDESIILTCSRATKKQEIANKIRFLA